MKNRTSILCLSFALVGVLLGGCAASPVSLTSDAEKVQIATGVPSPDEYREVGQISGQHGDGCGGYGLTGTYDGALNALKNQAVAVDADIVVITSTVQPHVEGLCGMNAWIVSGTAYKKLGTAEDEASFETIAAAYQSALTKPALSEEAHRFKVYAEVALQEKNYRQAADYYAKALAIDPWWPEGHFNRAIVLAESDYYGALRAAAREMKRYLRLVPDAPNARAAQDKIYEWELKAGN